MPRAVVWRLDRRGGAARWVMALSLACVLAGCRRKPTADLAPGDAGPSGPAGLTREQAVRVLAKVGDRTITLGDYAATLERMDQFDRLRYQSAERRKELLEELIDAELLAEDARKEKLDQRPETQQAIRQILRDAVLADARKGLPPPANFTADEVRGYYEAHPDDFQDPERRRVSHILFKDRDVAAKVLATARKTSAREWGELYMKHSVDAARKGTPSPPLELAGDLGLVGPPGEPRGDNPRVPPAVRVAVFELTEVGEVAGRVVADTDGFHLVRMVGKSEARKRTLPEADRAIRVALLQAKLAEREHELESELRKQSPVVIDEQALASVAVPAVDGGVRGGAPAAHAGSQP